MQGNLGFYDYTPYPSKVCVACKVRKPLDDFHKYNYEWKRSAQRRQPYCKPCQRAKIREYKRRVGFQWSKMRTAHGARLYWLQGGKCAGCKVAFLERNLEIDHIVPKSEGGGNGIDNLQLLCSFCNRLKSSYPMGHLIAMLKEQGIIK